MHEISKNLQEIVKVLEKHKIEYIIVGGVGPILQGANISTKDIDVCPENSQENFVRLSVALKDIVASKRFAGRPKDLAVLPELEELLRQQEGCE